MPVDVKVRKGETVEKALRRLKRKLIYENILRDAKDKRYFEAPSEKRRRKKKVAAFNNMLRQKHDFL
ncbi:MAG: 30S ribosomal protein S21 [Opitutales bacterium]|jgi:small subunit ribosomal protein S21|nr:30S ribosomal protein S21 [Opitutales bacterium]